MKVWFPTIRVGSGTDVYSRRLSSALETRDVQTMVTWLPHRTEFAPWLARVAPPAGTTLIHANSWSAFAFARFGLPVVAVVHLSMHAPEFARYKSPAQRLYHATLIRAYERLSFDRASAVVAVSAATRQAVVQSWRGVDPVVIRNGVDTRRFQPAETPAGAAPRRPFRLLFAGNRSLRKGWDLMPELMSRLGAGFELAVCGLRSDVPARELPPHAVSLGVIAEEAEMVRAYQSCDALIMPSRLEGLSYVVLEAMACGKPVIAFQASSMPEAIADGESGFLVPPDDVPALVAACRRLADDRELGRRMGAAARARAVGDFSESVMAQQYVDLYRRLALMRGGG